MTPPGRAPDQKRAREEPQADKAGFEVHKADVVAPANSVVAQALTGPGIVTQTQVHGGVFTSTQTLVRNGLYSMLVTSFNPVTLGSSQRLFRRDDHQNPHWVDVTKQALQSEYLNPAGTKKGELSVEWNMLAPAPSSTAPTPSDPARQTADAVPGGAAHGDAGPGTASGTAAGTALGNADPRPVEQMLGDKQEDAYPTDLGYLSTYLLRNGYVEQIAKVIGPAWRSMSETQLTAYLSQNLTEKQIQEQFAAASSARTATKVRFRRGNVIAAFVIGLVWARSNFAEGDWAKGIAKVSATTLTSWVFNRMVYARDPAVAQIMARAPGRFGRWFQGAARGNKVVTFLARDVARGLLIWDLKDLLMSGGGGGPNIPFDLIVTVDIDDPTTWHEPNQTLLDLGFNIWYRQAQTINRPTPDLYLGKVEGSMLKGAAWSLYGLLKASFPLNQETMEEMVREGAKRDYERFKEVNPDATPADYERMQQQWEDFETWGIR